MPIPKKTAPANKASEYVEYDSANGPFWTMDAAAESRVFFAKSGVASERGTPFQTLMELFDKAVTKHPNKDALRTENMGPLGPGEKVPPALPRDQWKSWTWKQYKATVRTVAKGFIDLGLKQHDSVNILGFNSPEWFFAMMGSVFAGGMAAGVYATDNTEQVQYKSEHSNASIAVVEDQAAFEKFAEVANELPYLKAIVCWAYVPDGDITRDDGSTIKCITFEQLTGLGRAVDDSVLEERMALVKPTHCCALIYTSGTTGRPKAVMISHDNLMYETSAIVPNAGSVGAKKEEERLISYLTLSHVAGLMVDIITPIVITSTLKGWMCSHFARVYDLKAGTLGQRLVAVEPTIFLGVPRVWEKIAEKLQAVGAATKGLKKKLSTKAKRQGLETQNNQQLGGSGKSSMGFIAKLLLGVIKKKLGLHKTKFSFAGAAPMTKEILSYFGSLGINVNEVYGMSECTGATTWSTDAAHEWGTIGFEMPGAEVKIFRVAEDGSKTECPAATDVFHATEAEQGEICFRGRHIMMGYLANPKLGAEHMAEIEKKNTDAIDEEGWLHSGDKGAVSTRGMVRITGRYKELIIGAGGENIAPVPIEDAIKAKCPYVSNAMMFGDQRKFNIVLLTLKCVGATGELPGSNELDGPAKAYGATIENAINQDQIIEDITAAIKAVGLDGDATPSNAAKIQKFTILPTDFSVVGEELTATLKLKRTVAADKYADIIEAMYESSEVFVPYDVVGSYDVQGRADPRAGSFKGAESFNMVSDDVAEEYDAENDD